jgi:hypothetical protein
MLGGAGMSDGMGTPEAQKDLSRYTTYLSFIFFGMCLLVTLISARCGGPQQLADLGDAPTPPLPTASSAATAPPADSATFEIVSGEELEALMERISASPESFSGVEAEFLNSISEAESAVEDAVDDPSPALEDADVPAEMEPAVADTASP